MFDLKAFIESQQKLGSIPKNKNIKSTKVKTKQRKDSMSTNSNSSNKVESCSKLDSDKNQCVSGDTSDNGSEGKSSQSEYFPSDEEYIPSEEELEQDRVVSCSLSGKKSNKCGVTKYADDGKIDCFSERIKEWKTNNGHYDDFHEINEGFKIPNTIWKQLFRYQKTGVKWLWELHQIESGGLLGDEMGLGKTVQIIAFLAGLSFTKGGVWGGLGPSLIVAPATVLHQWVEHFHRWWPPFRVAILHNSGSYTGSPESLVRDIHNHHGILITTYSGIVQHKSIFEARKWHYVVLDEGHKIRNYDTQVSKAVRKIRTPHRIVVTGSPMQNNLQELWSIFDFMSPGLLGTLQVFIENFANPITQGGYANASKFQETAALSLATTLKNVITPYMLRRTKAEVKEHLKLPEKKEQVLFCSLSDEQKNIYKTFLLSDIIRSILDKDYRYGESYRAKILVALTSLRKICNHPDLYICEVDDEISDENTVTDNKGFGHWKRAGKMVVINSLLKIWKKQGHRALIFTQSRAMICILELFLEQNDYKYLKMDGSTSIGTRQPLVSLFNNDNSYLVFLATTRVGGLGVNLTGADRVIIYDPDWNPAIDGQAKERAWRIGQNREVTIYRLLSAGTVEEKIYQRQVFKQLLGNKVFLDPNQKNYLKTSSLQGLFSLEEPDKGGTTETTNIFQHTKINVKTTNENSKDNHILNGGVSFSKTKLDAMRRLAQQISKQITTTKPSIVKEDPRERYKKKLIPPPPLPEPPAVNIINDKVTDANFSMVLSEIDIVNMYSKPEPHDFLENTLEDGEISEETVEDPIENNVTKVPDPSPSTSKSIEHDKNEIKKKRKKGKRKRRRNHLEDLLNEEGLLNDEEFVNSVQRVKKKKVKEEKETPKDSDQYVLEKLFAKGVQSALQHDKVVGLAEGEERHKLQTAAQHHALRALKNLKKSRLKNWRW